MATPLKINNVGGTEIKQFTTAEENYIAYQIGLHLAADSANGDGTITSNSSHTSIGSYTNTFFNEVVGTHPSTSITSGSTTTTVYQNQTSAIETDSDIEIPLMWVDSGGQTGFKQMPSADLNEAVDRYLSTIFTNDYPGVFKLASSSPGPDYSLHISSVFTDTRTDGTSIAYNIYRRDSYTAPTAVRPLYVRVNGGFDGIQAMNDRQIKYSFGQRAKTRIGASKIGTYQLRSSAQGAPTDPGTWISAGSATDTKQTTADEVYVRDSTTSFAAQYTSAYTGSYTSAYTNNYTTNYTSNYTIAYTKRYDNEYNVIYINETQTTYFTAGYTGGYAPGIGDVSSYLGGSIYFDPGAYTTRAVYSNDLTFNPIYVAALVYTRPGPVVVYASQYFFEGSNWIYETAFDGTEYLPNTQPYIGNYTTTYTTPYDREASAYSNQFIAETFYTLSTAQYLGTIYYEGNYQNFAIYSKNYTGNYTEVYTQLYLTAISGKTLGYQGPPRIDNFTGTYTGASTGYYQGPTTFLQRYTNFLRYTTTGTTTTYYAGSARTGTSVNYYYITAAYYQTVRPGAFLTFIGPGGAAYFQTFRPAYFTPTYTTFYTGATNNYQTDYAPGTGTGYFLGYYSGGYQNLLIYLGTYIKSRFSAYIPTYTQAYSPVFSSTYTGDSQIGYTGTYVGGYQPAIYESLYQTAYLGQIETPGGVDTGISAYIKNFSVFYITNYENIYTNEFAGTYTTSYSPVFETIFSGQYQQDYLGNFEGNFAGLTIQSASQTEETYTLYVRIG